jgi:hypothetical protein
MATLKKHDLKVIGDDGKVSIYKAYRQKTWLDHLLIIVGFIGIVVMSWRIVTITWAGSVFGYFIWGAHTGIWDVSSGAWDNWITTNGFDIAGLFTYTTGFGGSEYNVYAWGVITKGTAIVGGQLAMGPQYYAFFDTAFCTIILIGYVVLLVKFAMYCVKDFIALCKEGYRAIKASRKAIKDSAHEYADQLKDVDVEEYDRKKKAEASKETSPIEEDLDKDDEKPAQSAIKRLQEDDGDHRDYDEPEKPVVWKYSAESKEPEAKPFHEDKPKEPTRRSDVVTPQQQAAPVEKKASDMSDDELDAMISGEAKK